jgi:hypothetical protein
MISPINWVVADDKADLDFFEQKIRPVLVQHCYSCHSVAAEEKKKLQGGLYLDSAASVLAGGETGPAIVKGKPAESLLLKALKFEGLEMPPTGKLPAEVIADFSKWIELGAPDPREGNVPVKPKREINLEEGKKFWSFQPVQTVTVPPETDPRWSQPVDRFIAAKQAEKGLKPNPPASKEKLIRRLYFDLIGLPPTPAQVDAFLKDDSPNALEKVIDELLASEHYGERWGRHWLDVARFAESGGYEFDGFRNGAYHYRDWVIRAFNRDLPFHEFVRLQLAGDQLIGGYEGVSATGFLVAGPYPGQITAKTVERIRYDQLDDMLMTVGGSMLGLTLGCVRCHEHKYDPIPHQDYYALAASLAKTSHGSEMYDPDVAGTERKVLAHQQQRKELFAPWEKLTEGFGEKLTAWKQTDEAKQPATSPWQRLEVIAADAERAFIDAGPDGLIAHEGKPQSKAVVRRGRQKPKTNEDITYELKFHTYQKNLTALRMDALPEKSLPKKGPGLGGDGSFLLIDISVTAFPVDKSDKAPEVKNPELKLKPRAARFEEAAQPLANTVDDKPNTFWRAKDNPGKSNVAVWEIEGGLAGFEGGTEIVVELTFRNDPIGRLTFSGCFEALPGKEPEIHPAGQTLATAGTAAQIWEVQDIHPFDMPLLAGTPEPQHRRELLALDGANLSTDQRLDGIRWLAPFDAAAKQVVTTVEAHDRQLPRPNYVEVYTTVAGGQDVFFLRRGEVENKQGKANAGVLQVLYRPTADPTNTAASTPKDPRVALADWITDADQGAGPLLARVIVNRVWQHHFGEGLVSTPNDFGAQGERPSHPELLEWLTAEFIRGGWKIKALHKQLLLTATWQQGNEVSPDNVRIDPANRFLWHYRPRRLDAEIIRDALLAVGGNLDTTKFGPSFLDNPRRSVYLRVKRSELIPFMTMFDAPEPTQSQGTRISTTVPTQALLLMNSPFTRQQAEKLASRAKPAGEMSLDNAIANAYRLAFARLPSDTERQRMVAFIGSQAELAGGPLPAATDKAFVEFCHVLLCLNEFVYVD